MTDMENRDFVDGRVLDVQVLDVKRRLYAEIGDLQVYPIWTGFLLIDREHVLR